MKVEAQQGFCTRLAPPQKSPSSPGLGHWQEGRLTPCLSLGVSAAPSPGEEEGGTPTPSVVEDWIATQVGPGVAAVPVGEETTAIPDFTIEPENQTEWEPAYSPAGTSPPPGL